MCKQLSVREDRILGMRGLIVSTFPETNIIEIEYEAVCFCKTSYHHPFYFVLDLQQSNPVREHRIFGRMTLLTWVCLFASIRTPYHFTNVFIWIFGMHIQYNSITFSVGTSSTNLFKISKTRANTSKKLSTKQDHLTEDLYHSHLKQDQGWIGRSISYDSHTCSSWSYRPGNGLPGTDLKITDACEGHMADDGAMWEKHCFLTLPLKKNTRVKSKVLQACYRSCKRHTHVYSWANSKKDIIYCFRLFASSLQVAPHGWGTGQEDNVQVPMKQSWYAWWTEKIIWRRQPIMEGCSLLWWIWLNLCQFGSKMKWLWCNTMKNRF